MSMPMSMSMFLAAAMLPYHRRRQNAPADVVSNGTTTATDANARLFVVSKFACLLTHLRRVNPEIVNGAFLLATLRLPKEVLLRVALHLRRCPCFHEQCNLFPRTTRVLLKATQELVVLLLRPPMLALQLACVQRHHVVRVVVILMVIPAAIEQPMCRCRARCRRSCQRHGQASFSACPCTIPVEGTAGRAAGCQRRRRATPMELVVVVTIRSRSTTTNKPDVSTGVNVAIAAVRRAHTCRRQMKRAFADAFTWSVVLVEHATDVMSTIAEYTS